MIPSTIPQGRRDGTPSQGLLRCLALTLAVALAAAAADPAAAVRDPHHDHIVVGGDALAQARALVLHLRFGHPVADAAETTEASASRDVHDDPGAPRVMDLRSGRASGLSLFSSAGSASLAASPVTVSPPVLAGSLAQVPMPVTVGLCTQSPDPPPRAS
jgi:hypothetical protein